MRSLVSLAVLFLAVALLPSPATSALHDLERKLAAVAPAAPPKNYTTVAVEGVIYCRCKLSGYVKDVDAAPLPGAGVLVRCKSGDRRKDAMARGTTDSHGYFYVEIKLISKWLARTCKVYVASTPVKQCTVPREYGTGGAGVAVMFEKKLDSGAVLYSAGFFEVGPPKSAKCYLK
ncbi:non-classical arabinogalactan protein 30-like [Canna indica]|uniref:Non-classical arabinogalactan protein 30-like n=1 Tax=Canna indica TaxID=4628 RepID=A0AAQ3JYP4_9LILI|nr:non-classical arabinogalactan protein 30-like [Canna indica]